MEIIRSLRDAFDFVRAKRSRGERIRLHVNAAAEASYTPRDAAGFALLRARLRYSPDFGRASERVDALEVALRRRHGGAGLPLPRRLMQNSDRSISIWWGDSAMVRAFPDGFFSLIGGTKGIPAKRITSELLDLLAFQARIQAQ